MTFDPKRPVQLRNGWRAIICERFVDDSNGYITLLGRFEDITCHRWIGYTWEVNGKRIEGSTDDGFDLINIPKGQEKAEFLVNVYKTALGFTTSNDSKLIRMADGEKGPFACVKISCKRGEGL